MDDPAEGCCIDEEDVALKLEERLFLTRFNVYRENHLHVDPEMCHECKDKPCTYVCPVKDYVWENGRIVVSFEGCVECGACAVVCPYQKITVKFPPAGHGVCFRHG